MLQAGDTDMIMLSVVLADPSIANPTTLADELVDRLVGLGKGLVRDGEALRDRASMLPHAETLATAFLETTVPGWKAQGVV